MRSVVVLAVLAVGSGHISISHDTHEHVPQSTDNGPMPQSVPEPGDSSGAADGYSAVLWVLLAPLVALAHIG
jgi:hypothetical protein